MSSINATQVKTGFKHKRHTDDFLDEIGKKLPKKLRKKVRWKKIRPVLGVLIIMFAHLAEAFSGKQTSNHTPSPKERSYSAPTRKSRASSPKFTDNTLQGYVEQAQAYQREIDYLAQNTTDTSTRNRVRELATHVQAWTTSIGNLAQRVEDYKQNKLIKKDLKDVPKSISILEARLDSESDPMMIAELERTLTNRQQQLSALEKLRRNIQMAEIKIENTLSLLGTIYSQILAGQSTRQVADYRRLLVEIDEEVHTLEDHLEALEEVKMSRV